MPPIFAEPQMAHPARNAPWLSVALREAAAAIVKHYQAPRALRGCSRYSHRLPPVPCERLFSKKPILCETPNALLSL